MPRVDFYLLPDDGTRERFTCDIASKIRQQKLQIYIHANSREEACMLDDFLWTYRDISFLPHSLVDDDDGTNTITIGWQDQTAKCNDVLINLAINVPDCAAKFDRIVEIVAADEPNRQQARDRYKQYRQAGHELHNHDMNTSHDIA